MLRQISIRHLITSWPESVARSARPSSRLVQDGPEGQFGQPRQRGENATAQSLKRDLRSGTPFRPWQPCDNSTAGMDWGSICVICGTRSWLARVSSPWSVSTRGSAADGDGSRFDFAFSAGGAYLSLPTVNRF